MSMPLELPLLVLVLTSVLDVLEWIVKRPVEIFQAYTSLIRWAADSVQELFEDYGYWVVFFGTLAENTLLIGLIVPGAIVVILAGLAAQEGSISYAVFCLKKKNPPSVLQKLIAERHLGQQTGPRFHTYPRA